jgi:hypothetical protein
MKTTKNKFKKHNCSIHSGSTINHQGNISKNEEIRSRNTPSSRKHQVTADGEKIEAKN